MMVMKGAISCGIRKLVCESADTVNCLERALDVLKKIGIKGEERFVLYFFCCCICFRIS